MYGGLCQEWNCSELEQMDCLFLIGVHARLSEIGGEAVELQELKKAVGGIRRCAERGPLHGNGVRTWRLTMEILRYGNCIVGSANTTTGDADNGSCKMYCLTVYTGITNRFIRRFWNFTIIRSQNKIISLLTLEL